MVLKSYTINLHIALKSNKKMKINVYWSDTTDNPAMAYYIDDVYYVAFDDVTGKVIQIADMESQIVSLTLQNRKGYIYEREE